MSNSKFRPGEVIKSIRYAPSNGIKSIPGHRVHGNHSNCHGNLSFNAGFGAIVFASQNPNRS